MADQFLDAALALAARGLPVFPIEEGCKFPPRVKFKAAATTDETQIRMWWARWPESNIGVYTNAFVVVDVDNKHGHFGSLSHMEAGISSETFRVATPSDGWHDYHLGHSVAPCIAGDGLDVKSDGSYVLGPGSYLDPENPKNKGKVCTRSGSHPYMLSLLGSLIERNGGLLYQGYFAVARRYLLRPHDRPVHPFGPNRPA